MTQQQNTRNLFSPLTNSALSPLSRNPHFLSYIPQPLGSQPLWQQLFLLQKLRPCVVCLSEPKLCCLTQCPQVLSILLAMTEFPPSLRLNGGLCVYLVFLTPHQLDFVWLDPATVILNTISSSTHWLQFLRTDLVTVLLDHMVALFLVIGGTMYCFL